MDELKRTSERVVEGEATGTSDRIVFAMHVSFYRWVAERIRGRVLDYGAGTGYGSAILAEATDSPVVGVDVSGEAVRYAAERYRKPNLTYAQVSADDLPYPDECFSTVVSSQVIEHVDPVPYLSQASRVLAPGGELLVFTPNRDLRLYSWQQPWNRWHATEYSERSLRSLLLQYFNSVMISGQTASADVVARELSRYRRMRRLLLPATLPFLPYGARKGLLGVAARLQRASRGASIDEPMRIGEDTPWLNLIACATK